MAWFLLPGMIIPHFPALILTWYERYIGPSLSSQLRGSWECKKQIPFLGNKILVSMGVSLDFLCYVSVPLTWIGFIQLSNKTLRQPLICSGLGWWVEVLFHGLKPQQLCPSSSKVSSQPGPMWHLPAELCLLLLSCAGEGSWIRDNDCEVLYGKISALCI